MTVTPIDKAEHCKRTLGVAESTAALYLYVLSMFIYVYIVILKSLAFIKKIKCFLSKIFFNIFFLTHQSFYNYIITTYISSICIKYVMFYNIYNNTI